MESDETEAVLVEASDEEVFVDLESDEVDRLLNDVGSLFPLVVDSSDTGGETTCAESEDAGDPETNCPIAISSSASGTVVSDDGNVQGVSSSVHDRTLSDTQTLTIGLDETVTDSCNRNEEGRTTFSQTIALEGNGDLCGDDQNILPEHSVPVVVEVETSDGGASVVSSTVEADVIVISSSSISSLSTSETELTSTSTETFSAGHSETSAVCPKDPKNRATLTHTTESHIGLRVGKHNRTDVSQAKSVNVRELAAYTGLKLQQIMLPRIDAVPVQNSAEIQSEGTECSVAQSTAAADVSPGSAVSLSEANQVPSLQLPAEECHGHLGDCLTADGVITTGEYFVTDGVSSTDDAVAVFDDSLVPDDGVSLALNEPGDVFTVSYNTEPVVGESPCQSVGLKRAHMDDSVGGCPAKQQKIEDSSSSLFPTTFDDVSAACFSESHTTAEHSLITDSFEPTAALDVEAVDVSNSQPMLTSEPTGFSEDVVIEEQVVIDSVIDAVADNDNPQAPEDVMTGLLSVAIAEAINDIALVPDGSDVDAVNSVFNADYSAQGLQEVACISTDMEADQVAAAGDGSTADMSNSQQNVMSGSNENVLIEEQMVVDCVIDAVAGNDNPLAAEDFMTGLLGVAIAEAMTSTSAAHVSSSNDESDVVAVMNSDVLSTDVVTGKIAAGARRELLMPPPPPTVTKNAGSKMRMRMEAANKDKLPASTAAKRGLKNRSKTVALTDTPVWSSGAEQTTAVDNKDAESSIPAAETESEEQTLSNDEEKVEPLLEWRSPPTKTGTTVKDAIIPTTDGGAASDEKLSSEQLANQTQDQKQNKLSADKKKVTPLMECQPRPRRASTRWQAATTDSSPVIEWKPAPSHRSKSAPIELGQLADSSTEPRMLQLRSQSENIAFSLPQNDEDLRTPALGGQQLPVPGQMPVIIMSSASLAPVMAANAPVVPSNVVPGQTSVMLPVHVNSAPAVLPPAPSMVPPPTVNCQAPSSMLLPGQSGQPAPPGVVMPPPSNDLSQTPPHVVHAQQPLLSQPLLSPMPVAPPTVSPQSQGGPSPGQPVPPGVFEQPPAQISPAVPGSKPPSLLATPPRTLLPTPVQEPPCARAAFGSNRPPRPGMVPPRPVPAPQPVPPPGHPSPQRFPPPYGGPAPHWGPVPPPHAAPPMWGPPPPGVPPPGYNQVFPGPHGPPEWVPPPGPAYMQPGLPGPSWGPPPMDYPPPDGGWWAPPAFGVPTWGPPHGPPPDWGGPPPHGPPPDWGPPPHGPPPDWSYPAQPQSEPSTGSEPSKAGGDAEAGGDENSETASLARAAREWAEWQQRYTDWYNTYYGYAATTPASSASVSAYSSYSTAVTTSVPTRTSFTGNKMSMDGYSKNSYSALAPNASRAAYKTFGAASSVRTTTSFAGRSVSKNAAIPLPSKQPVTKPGTADAFAKFAEKAGSNVNPVLGMSSNKPRQNTANQFISSYTHASTTSVTPLQGYHLLFFSST